MALMVTIQHIAGAVKIGARRYFQHPLARVNPDFDAWAGATLTPYPPTSKTSQNVLSLPPPPPGRRQLPGTLNAMNGKTNKYDRVLEQHRRAKQAQEGMEMALADHRDALAAAALLNEALQQHRSLLDFGGDMSQALEWQKKILEANGGLPQLLAKHQAALAAAAAVGQALERHQAALEAGRRLGSHRR